MYNSEQETAAMKDKIDDSKKVEEKYKNSLELVRKDNLSLQQRLKEVIRLFLVSNSFFSSFSALSNCRHWLTSDI